MHIHFQRFSNLILVQYLQRNVITQYQIVLHGEHTDDGVKFRILAFAEIRSRI